MLNNKILAYARSGQSRFVNELMEFVRFPTVGTQMEHVADMKKCAGWLANHLRSIGLEHVKLIATPAHPTIYAEWLHKPGYPIVLIYGHYDVQPADPINEWTSPPFEPVVHESYLYGRGASDDKGQLFTHIKALECYLKTTGELPVNVKCLFEGEEESGSAHLTAFLTNRSWEIAADVALLSDMPMLAPDRPAITYALRGALSLELKVSGPPRDLHSGIFGGMIHNPLQELCEILARLHDASGRIGIPGFYDRVRTWNRNEREYMAKTGPSEHELLRSAQVLRAWGEPHFTAYERTTIRPSLSVNGVTGGYQGIGPKAVIPAHASVKLNFRLVPDQEPQEIDRLFRKYVTEITPPTVRVTFQTQFTARPTLLDVNHPALQAAVRAYRYGFGATPVLLRCGGTIPVVDTLQNILGIPTILMGFALPDDQMHGPNEKFYLPNFFHGIHTSIYFLSAVGFMRRPIQEMPCSDHTFALSG